MIDISSSTESSNDFENILKQLEEEKRTDDYYQLLQLYKDLYINPQKNLESNFLMHIVHLDDSKDLGYAGFQILHYSKFYILELLIQFQALINHWNKKREENDFIVNLIEKNQISQEEINAFERNQYMLSISSEMGFLIGNYESMSNDESITSELYGIYLSFHEDNLVICYCNCEYYNVVETNLYQLLNGADSLADYFKNTIIATSKRKTNKKIELDTAN